MKRILEEAVKTKWKLCLYKNVLKDSNVIKYLSLLEEMTKTISSPSVIISLYYDYFTSFMEETMKTSKERMSWSEYILRLIVKDENSFSLQSEKDNGESISPLLTLMAQKDLRQFQAFTLNGTSLLEILKDTLGNGIDEDDLVLWEEIDKKENKESKEEDTISKIILLKDWGEGAKTLSAHYNKNGAGIYGQYHAFRWVSSNEGGRLIGVKNFDDVEIDKLFEYKREQERLLENTRLFINGFRANNVLLYGDRGTGKSSTVKALVNLYGGEGLRLIEVQKQDLKDFPSIMAMLAQRPQRFIIFVDDLSFAENEGEYRDLKALLEGGVEVRPQNVVVYATSNRRHLVQEKHSDREITRYDLNQEDVRPMDTIQEKLSLADRFGITITFSSPNQEEYLSIVEKLASDRGIKIDVSELRRLALQWELKYNVRSPRTARQFVDYLEAKIALDI